MDVFRFVKLPQQANDPTRRYTVVSVAGERVGDVEVVPPLRGKVVMSVVCYASLSDAARADALTTARRFLDELALGWGVHLVEGSETGGPQEQPDERFIVRLEYDAI